MHDGLLYFFFIFIEFVRSYAEHCLKDIIQLLFSRLVTLNKEQGNSSKVSKINSYYFLIHTIFIKMYNFFIYIFLQKLGLNLKNYGDALNNCNDDEENINNDPDTATSPQVNLFYFLICILD